MPDVLTKIEYLQDLPLYKTEKPYWCLLPPHEGFDPDTTRVDNLEFETRSEIPIKDIRPFVSKVRLDDYGFQVLSHTTDFTSFATKASIDGYKRETEHLLQETFQACCVKTYDLILRKNVVFVREELDLLDPFHTEGPARGAHNDITYKSGPEVIQRYLGEEQQHQYMRSGYRFRIINTWRSRLPVVEDRPLALCDSRSVDTSDLMASDRIIPNRVGEVYYLKFNPKHQWYWLSKQASSEPFAFVMYDTKAGQHRRFCPHVSFQNPEAPTDAPPRQSIETRSIVITKED